MESWEWVVLITILAIILTYELKQKELEVLSSVLALLTNSIGTMTLIKSINTGGTGSEIIIG